MPEHLVQHDSFDRYRKREYKAALEVASEINVPGFFWVPLCRAAALGMLGRERPGRDAIAELMTLRPDFAADPRRYLDCYLAEDPLIRSLIEGLGKAGLERPRLAETG